MIAIFVQSLALARLLRLFIEEDGPFGILEKFRCLIGIDGVTGVASNELGDLFTCHLCLGIWLVPIIAFLYMNHYTYWIVWCLAVAQGASFIYAATNRMIE